MIVSSMCKLTQRNIGKLNHSLAVYSYSGCFIQAVNLYILIYIIYIIIFIKRKTNQRKIAEGESEGRRGTIPNCFIFVTSLPQSELATGENASHFVLVFVLVCE